MRTCLYNGYMNPFAYLVFPQLYDIEPKTDDFIEQARFNGTLRVISMSDDSEDLIFTNTNKIDLSSFAGKEIRISLVNQLGDVILGGWVLPGEPFVQPIASYRCYDKTNDDEDRDILQDLSGNGHDIQLYNFAFTEGSGYNKSTYKGALVSDGVDDYGLCENFPILSPEKGFTICAIRTYTYKGALCGNNGFKGAFVFDGFGLTWKIYSFGKENIIDLTKNLFSYMTSSDYNGKSIQKGNSVGLEKLFISRFSTSDNRFYNGALYALEIYDRDLTDEEIAKVKARMIAEYESKTGNTYEDYMKLNKSKLDIAKLK